MLLNSQAELANAVLSSERTVTLQSGGIHDLSPLRSASALESLCLDATNVASAEVLGQLPQLRELALHQNRRLADYSFLENTNQLQTLKIAMGWPGARISKRVLLAIASQSTLRCLHLTGKVGETDLSMLSSLLRLEELSLCGIQVRGGWLSGLTRLRSLWLDQNGLGSLASLSALTQLRELVVLENRISNTDELCDLPQLQRLLLHRNRIVDVSALSSLQTLEQLELDENRLSRWNLPAPLPALRVLSLRRNQLTSVETLARLPALETLYLQENPLRSIEPLAHHPTLRVVQLGARSRVNRTPLTTIPHLRQVDE